jgi:hypothetical protein
MLKEAEERYFNVNAWRYDKEESAEAYKEIQILTELINRAGVKKN